MERPGSTLALLALYNIAATASDVHSIAMPTLQTVHSVLPNKPAGKLTSSLAHATAKLVLEVAINDPIALEICVRDLYIKRMFACAVQDKEPLLDGLVHPGDSGCFPG